MKLCIWGVCHEVSCSIFIALSYCLPLFPLSWNFIFQQLYLSTWMQQNQSYQQHHPWDPRPLSGLGKHQQLRNLLLLPPATFLKCHQRRTLDTAERKHFDCKIAQFWKCLILVFVCTRHLVWQYWYLQYRCIMSAIIQAGLCASHT